MALFDEPAYISEPSQPLDKLWVFLPFGYLFTILVETPIVVFGLSPKLSLKQRLFCGIWLTACTYPIVILVLPNLMTGFSRTAYLAVAETFAPVAECLLFWLLFRGRVELNSFDWLRSFIAIVIANLASFLLGEVLNSIGWFGLF